MFKSWHLPQKRNRRRLLKLARRCQEATDLCAKAASIVGLPIVLAEAPDLPTTVSAISLKNPDHFLILYKPTHAVSIQLSILHELAHICLGHLDGVHLDLKTALEGKTYFSDAMETEAEKLAIRLLSVFISPLALSPKNSPVGARFESLFE